MPRVDAEVATSDFGRETEATTGDAAGHAPTRSVRRATARRASKRRATARSLHADEEEIIIGFLIDNPGSTAGDLAKGLNLDPDGAAAHLARLANRGEITRSEHGYIMTDAADADARP